MSPFVTAVSQALCTDIARIILALVLVLGTLLVLLSDRQVPDVLWALDGAAIGFWFGGATATK